MANLFFDNNIKILHFSDLERCPFCGCQVFYVRQHAEGTIIHRFCANGEEIHNEDMYDMLTVSGGKKVYCEKCENFLGNCETNKISIQALKAFLKNKDNTDADIN